MQGKIFFNTVRAIKVTLDEVSYHFNVECLKVTQSQPSKPLHDSPEVYFSAIESLT